MAASVRIEDEAFGDGRYEHLGVLLGTSKFDAIGRMAYLWRQCTQEHRHVLPESFVAVFVDAEKLCESRLGERVEGGIRIRGTRGRIEWLAKLRKNGRKGGRPRKPNGYPDGLANHNQERTRIEPESNPPAPAPAPAPAQEEKRERVRKLASTAPLPDGWKPEDTDGNRRAHAVARDRGVDVRGELDAMRDYAIANPKFNRKADWNATWRGWLRRAKGQTAQQSLQNNVRILRPM